MARGVTASHTSAVGARSLAGSREFPHLLLHTSGGSVGTPHVLNYKTWGLGSGHTNGLTRESCCQRCSLADGRVMCAKGQRRWSLPGPKDNPTAPTDTEERPTAAVLLSWPAITTLVRRADTVRGELHHRSPLSHLCPALLLATEPPAIDQCGKEQSPFRKSSLLHCPAAAGPSASAPACLANARPSHPGGVWLAGMPQLVPSAQEGCCP